MVLVHLPLLQVHQLHLLIQTSIYSGVRYNEQFLPIKSGCYNEHRRYKASRGILSADVARACARRVRLHFILGNALDCLCYSKIHALDCLCYSKIHALDCLCYSKIHVQCIKVKKINFILFSHLYF